VGNSSALAQNKQQTPGKGFSIARVNQVSAEATAKGDDIALGMFYINAIPATILFDSGATHSFMSARYANTNELPLKNMKTPMLVITPKGPVEANHMTHKLILTIMGREFWATAIILEASNIDLILGMSWLRKAKAIIQCGRGTVELTSPKGERFQVEIAITTSTQRATFFIDEEFVGDNIRVVRDFSDVFPVKLPGMAPERQSFLSYHMFLTQMVNTRKGGGIDLPPPNRHSRRIYRQPQQQEEEMNPPNPPPSGANPTVVAQMQIMQQMADTMADIHAQMRQERQEMHQERRVQQQQAPLPPPPPPPVPPRDKHREFMSHKPPTFASSPDPLHVGDLFSNAMN
jgi:hypothetical protein